MNIVHKVDLTRELPDGVRAARAGGGKNSELDYDILGMWKYLQTADPQQYAEAKKFEYPPEVALRDRPLVLFPSGPIIVRESTHHLPSLQSEYTPDETGVASSHMITTKLTPVNIRMQTKDG